MSHRWLTGHAQEGTGSPFVVQLIVSDGAQQRAEHDDRHGQASAPSGPTPFLREVQGAWDEINPYAEECVKKFAAKLGLERRSDEVARLMPRLPGAPTK